MKKDTKLILIVLAGILAIILLCVFAVQGTQNKAFKLGYFHRWEQWSKVVDASPLRGGHPGGQNGQVFGIVEFEDGVRRVGPSSIKFCDEENAILCEMAKHHEELRRGEANAES